MANQLPKLTRFIRIGDTFLNPQYITSIGVKDGVKGVTKARVEVKLVTQQAELGGNLMRMYGSQKRCCYWWEFDSKKEAHNWIQHKFKSLVE
jgi:hypothetical protein